MVEYSTAEYCTHRRPKLTFVHLFAELFRKEFFLTHQNLCKDQYVQGSILANILMSEENSPYNTDL